MEEIASREQVNVDTIKRSIDKVEAYRYVASAEEVDMAYNHMALELVEKQAEVLMDAMNANRYRVTFGGDEVIESDHATRLRALEVAKSFTEVSRPKGPATQVNIQQNNNSGGNGSGGGISFESRLREIRAKNAVNLLPDGGQVLLDSPQRMSQMETIESELEDLGFDEDEEEEGDDILDGEDEDGAE